MTRRTVMAGLALAPVAGAAAREGIVESESSLVLPSGRVMPFRLWRPVGDGPLPLMLFSHGAFSRPDKYRNLVEPMAAAGFVVAAPLHADTPDHPGGGKIDPADSMAFRMEDMRALIRMRASIGADNGPVVACGHSFGALIAQILVGARVAARGTGAAAEDGDCDLALAFSPPGPFPPNIPETTWETVSRPMFVQTGTADILPMIAPRWEAHKLSYDTTPAPALLFVGEGVDHYFGNLYGRPERTETPQRVQFDGAIAAALALVRAVRSGGSIAAITEVQPGLARLEARNV
ncbi:MAG: alpha/beta fold hydrolase [Polymorphobacter sp.]|uniref:alpha/beta fold hydrolase n=1 Tax=Polymorphobacter sp. TaxID=1909290 RepID=UPI003A8B31E6